MERNVEAAASGDLRKQLEALRDTLAHELDNTTSNTHAQLASQYRATCEAIAALPPAEGKSASERLAERIAAANTASRTA